MGSRVKLKKQISRDLEENLREIRAATADSMDIVLRRFRLGNGQEAVAFFIDGLVNKDLLGRDFFQPLMQAKRESPWTAELLAAEVIHSGEVNLETDFSTLFDSVLQGLVALFIEGCSDAISIEIISWPQRSIGEPETDVVIRGPREGFIESLRINVALLRRKIHHPDFTVETLRLGRYSQTDLCLVYVSSIANRDVLDELKKRLKKIDIDGLMDSGSLEQLIQDTPFSLFPTIGITEKPDIAAGRILEGRILLLLDGSPIALTLPMLFVEGLQSAEDYYTRFYYASWLRLLRGIAFLLNLYLPGFFLAAAGFHQQVIPFKLLLSMSAAESVTPFSTGVSMLLIWVVYEILREAGVRLPKPAGQAISIVGAIVMGDAAVNANLISAPVLIVLAITIVSSFVNSTYTDASSILRLCFLLLGWQLGLFGLFLGSTALLLYLCSLESFGTPFFAPFAPLQKRQAGDSLLRLPLWMLRFRPGTLSRNHRRMADMSPGKEDPR
ncbi:MAG: spore germination protein [Bacillota bacterium]|nr:spore germination protein [Bacillota bacterium]